MIDSLLVTGFPYDVHKQTADLVTMFGGVPGSGARGAAARIGGARSLLRGGRTLRRLLGAASLAVGRRGRRADRDRGGGTVTGMDGSAFDPAAAHLVASNGRVHDAMLDVIREVRQRARNRTN